MSARDDRAATPVDVSSILRDGAHSILDDFALRREMYAKVIEAFLDGVETLASRASRLALADAGLRKLHEHFPVAKIRLLEAFVLRRLREDLKERAPLEAERTIRTAMAERLGAQAPTRVCRAADLAPGHKLVLDLDNAKLVLWRDRDGVRAFRRLCPHLGMDVGDGYHDDDKVFCPGHGVAFSWADGTSHCPAFRLRAVEAYERDGYVYVQASGPDGA